jgi:hypothetical protein
VQLNDFSVVLVSGQDDTQNLPLFVVTARWNIGRIRDELVASDYREDALWRPSS